MSNVLSEAKKQQVIALGRLGWPLRRIEQETGVRRETAGAYLKAAGIGVRPPGVWGRRPPAKPANRDHRVGRGKTSQPQNRPSLTMLPSVKHFAGALIRALQRERHFALAEIIAVAITKARV